MNALMFYEKPGCATNRRQQQLLKEAGVTLAAFSILEQPWSAAELREYFGEKPVHEWFNYSAPAIKHGDIDPHAVTAEEALTLMEGSALLIKRPLIKIGQLKMSGFDLDAILAACGKQAPHDLAPEDVPQACAHGKHAHEHSCSKHTSSGGHSS